MTAPPGVPAPSSVTRPRNRALVVVALLWLVALVPLGAYLALLTVFGVTPTQCDVEDEVVFCDQGWLSLLTVAVVFLGWLAAVALAVSAAGGRRGGHLGLSVLALLVAVVVLVGSVSVWGQ